LTTDSRPETNWSGNFPESGGVVIELPTARRRVPVDDVWVYSGATVGREVGVGVEGGPLGKRSGAGRTPAVAPTAGSAVDPDDAALLKALHDEHAAALWGFVLHLTGGDRNRAEDVVQETMFRAWRRPAVLAQQGASARGWLFTVARNIVVDDWRAGQRRPTTSAELVAEPLEPDTTDTALQSIMVADAIRRLSRDHRAVLLECYFRGCTAAQAAARLGIPAGTVKSRLHYALHALRLVLEEMGVVT
jgi:RNA polymerase sigma-70 factor (ECF subfamily)